MRLIKRELAARLNVSERSLTSWTREGMPVLEHGRRGAPSYYDLGAVLRWVKRTRDPRYVGRVPIAQLEEELGAPAPVQMSALTDDELYGIRAGLGWEFAFLRLPAIAATAGVTQAQIDFLVDGMLEAYREELLARRVPAAEVSEMVESERGTIAEERAHPGSWTT
jgi:hypothetical protein